jgi:uncharacterized protein (DUF2062 family)
MAIVWISNPLTVTPLFYFTYRLGAWMLGRPDKFTSIEMSMDWLAQQVSMIWQPLLLGSLTCGLLLGTTSFAIVRIYWRWKVTREWHNRRARQNPVR